MRLLAHFETTVTETERISMESELTDVEQQVIFLNQKQKETLEVTVCTMAGEQVMQC